MLHAVFGASESSSSINPLIPELPDLVWSTVCFVIIFLFFWKYGLPRVTALLDERSAAIEGNIEKADEANKKAEALLEEYEAQLSDARTEAAHIRENARNEGQKIVAEAKDTALAEAVRVTSASHAQIEADRQAALVSLRGDVGSLALDLASRIVGEVLSDDKKSQAVVDRFLNDLEKSEHQTSSAKVANH